MRFALLLALATSICASAQDRPATSTNRATAAKTEATATRTTSSARNSVDCQTVKPLPTLPFLTVAEYDGTENISVDAWEKPGRLHVDADSLLILCVDASALDADPDYARKKISFEARIGSRAVEVQNYTEVGKPTDAVRVGLRSISLPELRTFMRRVGSARGAVGSVLISRAQDVLDSLTASTANDAVSEATSDILQTSISDLTARREDLASDLIAIRAARTSIESLEPRRPQLLTSSQQATASLQAARTALEQALTVEDIAAARLQTVTAANGTPQEIADAQTALQAARTARAAREQVTSNAATEAESRNRALTELDEQIRAGVESEARVRASIVETIAALAKLFPPREQDLRTAATLSSEVPNGYINLRTQDAKVGDTLYINLRVYPSENATTYRTVPLPPLYIRDFGFATNVSPSFMLVKRSSEPAANTQTSNFKGAAGISLLFSHRARRSETRWVVFNGLSAGINVSYLDFDTTQNLEVGAGPVFGLFRDRLHVGAGWNLNVPGDRFYYYVGFGFADIQNRNTGSTASPTTAAEQ
jgi:hypothetical protein